MAELKPCPFCGNKAMISWYDIRLDNHSCVWVTFRVECTACGVTKYKEAKYVLKSTGVFEDINSVYNSLIEEWNRRADNG